MLLQKHKNFYNNILFYTWKSLVSNKNWTLTSKFTTLCKKTQNIFTFCTICTKIYIKMICFWAVYSKIIIFAPTNMEQERMIQLRIAGKTTQSKAYFGKALSNLLSVKVIMLNSRFLFIQRVNRRSSETSHFRPTNKLFPIYKQVISNS